MIDKIKNSQFSNKLRIIFDYSRVTELLSGAYLELSFKVHDHLSNLRYGCLFSIDLKYAYLIISLYPDDYYYFASIISRIG